MKNFLKMKWAPRPLRIPLLCVIIGTLTTGPWGFVAGLLLGLMILPFTALFSAFRHYTDDTLTPGVWNGTRPSDNLSIDEMLRM